MSAVLRSIAAAVLVMLAHPAAAHGAEKHGAPSREDGAVLAQASPAQSSGTRDFEEAPAAVRSASDHAAPSGSVLTRLHPATVHFPIALLLAAALVEALAMARASAPLAQAATVMTVAGAAGAVVAALFGWIHTGFWLGGDTVMHWHRWTGTGLAIAAPIAAICAAKADRHVFRIVILMISIALLAQGYWGGELAHGPDHLGLGL